MLLSTLLLMAGLILLLAGGTGLVTGATGLAERYGVPPLVIGLTIVAFGTSAPELVVNLVGAVRGETALAFGNVAGSNLANLGLVLALAALIQPVSIQGQIVRRELPLLLLGSAILLVMALDKPIDGTPSMISRGDGIVLLLLFTVFVYITVSDFLSTENDPLEHASDVARAVPSQSADWIYVLAGLVGLILGGQLTIVNGAAVAAGIGVSPLVVGLLVVAIGTSMPELVTSIIAAVKGEADLCVGNVIGSNIFNGLVVLPISGIVRPLPVPEGGSVDIFASLLLAAILLPVFFFGSGRMNRGIALVFLIAYGGYMWNRAVG